MGWKTSIERFITNGSYIKMLENEKKLELLRNEIRDYQSTTGQKRFHWHTEGVIGIFESVRVFSKDSNEIKEYLMQLGVLPLVTTIKWKVLTPKEQMQLKPYEIKSLPKMKFSPTGELKVDSQKLNRFVLEFGGDSVSEKVMLWKHTKSNFEQLQREWKLIKAHILLDLNNNEPICCDFGSIVCMPSDPILRGIDVYRVLGGEVIIKYGSIDYEKLLPFISRGFISEKEVLKYRKVIDMRVRYMLIEYEKYNRRIDFYYQKLIRISNLSE